MIKELSYKAISLQKPNFFKLCIIKLVCIACQMMQYQIVWFTSLRCMHDLSGWGYRYKNDIFFYSKSIFQNGGCNMKSTVLGLKDDANIVLNIIEIRVYIRL